MKINPEQIARIRSDFDKMQSKEDFLHLLNVAKLLVYGEKAIPFELKQLNYYSHPKNNDLRYKTFKIKKKSGAERTIHAPVKGLKALQKCLSFVLQCVFEPHQAAFGFVRNKSIVDNARIHEGSRYVYNIDLKDFFPSVDQTRVWKCLQLKPFNLSQDFVAEEDLQSWEQFVKTYPVPPYNKESLTEFEAEMKGFKLEHLIPWEIFLTDFPDSEGARLPVAILFQEGLSELKVDLSLSGLNTSFYKGKGLAFAHTPKGTVFVSKNFDPSKDKYILIGNKGSKTKNGQSLEGTLWLVNKNPYHNRLTLANMIASICCTEMEVNRQNKMDEWIVERKRVLPQGAPTSPVITNIVCQRLDYLLTALAKRFGLKYSRYADDITFSSMHNVYHPNSEFDKELKRIIEDQRFTINETKTRLQCKGQRQEVTGLLVNDITNVQKRYVKQIRQWLYYWERYGYNRAYGYFLQKYFIEKGHTVKGKPNMVNVIAGKLDFLRMVVGNNQPKYRGLALRFYFLTGKDIPAENRNTHLNTVLEILSTKGIDEAMNYYQPVQA